MNQQGFKSILNCSQASVQRGEISFEFQTVGPLWKWYQGLAKPIAWMRFRQQWIEHNGLLMVPLTSKEWFRGSCRRDRSESRQREEHAISRNGFAFNVVLFRMDAISCLSDSFCGLYLHVNIYNQYDYLKSQPRND